MKIKTVCVHPPISVRCNDWMAYDDETYDGPGSPIGLGATRAAAVLDLMEQLDIESYAEGHEQDCPCPYCAVTGEPR